MDNQENNFNPVGWFEIYVQNMTRAKNFYENLFSVTLENLPVPDPEIEMWVFPMKEGAQGITGALAKMPGFTSGKNSVLVYFSSKDCLTEENRVADLGGKVIKPKTSIGEYGFFSLILDTENNIFGVHSLQ